MHKLSVGIVGASGYSGIEAARILAFHPGVEFAFLTSDRWAGESVHSRLSLPIELKFSGAPSASAIPKCDAVLLCTPAEVSMELAPAFIAAGTRIVIDLSGAFRLLDAASYKPVYGFEHTHAALLQTAVYGLPELFRSRIAGARLIANPGCYATVAALSVAPLLKAGVIDHGSVIIDAASGTTGAGKKATEDMSFSEVADDFRAYRTLKHQHTPEISQTVAHASGVKVPLTFTPHLLPLRRGILSTSYARLAPGKTPADLQAALVNAYAGEPFVQVVAGPDLVSLKQVVGTNLCVLGAAAQLEGADPGRVVVVGAIDNLVKGAAGQAVQNLNLRAGFREAEGLDSLRGSC